VPSNKLANESLLLTPVGWRFARNLPKDLVLVAVDRHGRCVEAEAQLAPSGAETLIGYVGTANAFGAFGSDTRLTANDGRKWTVNKLIEQGDASQVHFETVVRPPVL